MAGVGMRVCVGAIGQASALPYAALVHCALLFCVRRRAVGPGMSGLFPRTY